MKTDLQRIESDKNKSLDRYFKSLYVIQVFVGSAAVEFNDKNLPENLADRIPPPQKIPFNYLLYIITQEDISIYVAYSRPNGWTEWAEFF